MYTSSDTYPIRSGFKEKGGASELSAGMVDANPEKKLQTLVESTLLILMDADVIADDCATALGETVFYVRPLISALTTMNVVTKTGRRREGTVCGRSANILIPSNDLFDLVERHRPEDMDELRGIVRAFITARIEAERESQRVLRRGR